MDGELRSESSVAANEAQTRTKMKLHYEWIGSAPDQLRRNVSEYEERCRWIELVDSVSERGGKGCEWKKERK
jgi:hypothetical protein